VQQLAPELWRRGYAGAPAAQRLLVSVSSQYHQANHLDYRPCIEPDLPVTLSSEDYFANRDPALEAIWRMLSEPEPGGG
jgi:hypothetical protein